MDAICCGQLTNLSVVQSGTPLAADEETGLDLTLEILDLINLRL